MFSEVFAWICRTPRRLAVVGLSLVIIIFVGGSALFGNGSGSHGDSKTTSATSSTPSVTAAAVPPAGEFTNAAVTFVRVWSRLNPGETATQWQQKLQPLTTTELGKALRTTDTSTLPGVAPAGEPTVRWVSLASALIAVPLGDGTSVLVTVVSGVTHPEVSDIQPNTGD
jgi:hypothetical protein